MMMTQQWASLSQQRTESLKAALAKMERTTTAASTCADQLASRAGQLDSLTSPASDSSNMLTRANVNLGATLILMREAREKFDTPTDCEPAIERLHKGVLSLEDRWNRNKANSSNGNNADNNNNNHSSSANPLKQSSRGGGTGSGTGVANSLTEQDVYAAADSMEILRDTHRYFLQPQRSNWRATPGTISNLERLYKMGEDSMCLLVQLHLKSAGQGAKPQRHKPAISPAIETAVQARERLNMALQNRDLLKSIGEYDDYQPLEARPIREMRAIFDCLGSYGYSLGPASSKQREPPGLAVIFGLQPQHISRTEKVGSGCFNKLTKMELHVGFPQLDAYGMARRSRASNSLETHYRRLKRERRERLENKKATTTNNNNTDGMMSTTDDTTLGGIVGEEADAAARDAVRCLEHAMVIIAGEKNIYRTIVAPTIKKEEDAMDDDDDDDEEEAKQELSPYYKKACVAAYSYVVGSVVDRALDIIETVFLKEGGIGQSSGSSKETGSSTSPMLTITEASAAAAAGLRILDGVRMLGPSLAKLCEMNVGDLKTESNTSISAVLCIAIHRTTVKNAARTLENLAKAIQDDPSKGKLHRPMDASVSSVSRNVVQAIRSMSPFVSAYKSVSKRRALPWDPNMGEDAGELDSFVRYLVMRLLNSLKGKAIEYTNEGREDSQKKAHIFMINNAFYLMEALGGEGENQIMDEVLPPPALEPPSTIITGTTPVATTESDYYRIQGSWFNDKMNKMMESEKKKYLEDWEALNVHLTAVDNTELEFSKYDSKTLSHESGRLIKQRFSGFNDAFERTYQLHKPLCIIDPRLRLSLQQDVTAAFLPRYRRFYEKYTKVKFSKKHQGEYAKYSPDRIEDMMGDIYVDPV